MERIMSYEQRAHIHTHTNRQTDRGLDNLRIPTAKMMLYPDHSRPASLPSFIEERAFCVLRRRALFSTLSVDTHNM